MSKVSIKNNLSSSNNRRGNGDVAMYCIVNFIMYVSSNVLATRKWHCPVLAIYSTQLLFYTVARYGHTADLFFTPRAHVNHVYVRT